MTLAADLDSLYDLLKDHRTTSALARRVDGSSCPVHSPEAVSFCLLGACFKIGGDDEQRVERIQTVLRAALAKNNHSRWRFVLGFFNDTSTLEEVLDVVATAKSQVQ